jgi:hypothetical protein
MKPALAIGLLLLCAAARAQHKLDDDQSKLLEDARAESLQYSGSLPDFLCTETISRREDLHGDNRWRPIDTLTVRLSYQDHQENYKLVAIDGRQTDRDYLSVGGALTTGEFGNRLIALFVPASQAEFEWKGLSKLRGRRVAVFRYRIAKENSTFLIQAGADLKDRNNAIIAGYEGEVMIDEATHRVLKLTALAELPAGFPVKASTSVVEYDFRTVGGKAFLLPVSADATMRRGNYKTENYVQFRDYRKFQGESTISFDLPDKK